MKSWRKLAKELIYAYDKDDRFPPLLPPGYSLHNLDDLQRQRGSNEECLKAVIEKFIQRRGQYRQPSWRAILISLCNASEIHLAFNIKGYAEPLQGMWNVDTLCGIS